MWRGFTEAMPLMVFRRCLLVGLCCRPAVGELIANASNACFQRQHVVTVFAADPISARYLLGRSTGVPSRENRRYETRTSLGPCSAVLSDGAHAAPCPTAAAPTIVKTGSQGGENQAESTGMPSLAGELTTASG
jgi:hypothetical protein